MTRPLVLTAVAVLAVKLGWFAVERGPLFFMGDSFGYIRVALARGELADRGYTYGSLIWPIAVLPGTLGTLVFAQTLAGAATAWLLAYALMRFFDVRPAAAVTAAVAFALEPLQILHERMVLAESLTILALAAYFVLGLSYLIRPRALTLIAIAVTGVVLVSLRLVYVPVTLACAVLIPLLAWARPGKRLVAHLVLSLVVTLALHQAYKVGTGLRVGAPPAYQPGAGFFLVSAWAPLIEPEDATDPRARRVVETLLSGAPYPLRNLDDRGAQRWRPGGLSDELVRTFDGDTQAADAAARQMSARIVRRAPLSVAWMGARNLRAYWRSPASASTRARLLDEQGTARDLGPRFLEQLRETFSLDASGIAAMMTPSKRYHLLGAPWYLALTLSPLVGLLSVWWCRAEARASALLIAVVGAILLVVPALTGVGPTIRYLHPVAFGMVIALALIVDGVVRRISPRTPSCTAASLPSPRSDRPLRGAPPSNPTCR